MVVGFTANQSGEGGEENVPLYAFRIANFVTGFN
jgi:hypothetical protein